MSDLSITLDALQRSRTQLPVTSYFDQALFDIYEAGLIRYEDALRYADSVNDLRLQIKLYSKREDKPDIRPPDGLDVL